MSTPQTQGKGRPTPKRKESQRTRVAKPAPTNRKEALAQARERRREQAATNRAALRSGDVKALPAKERTPERILARDVVDRRRNAATVFLPFAFLFFISNLAGRTSGVASAAFILWLVAIVVLGVDSFFIVRTLRVEMRSRLAEPKGLGSTAFYAVMRAIMPRRFRVPKPRLGLGDPLPD